MLIKKLLEALPLTPGPKCPKKTDFTAGAAVHELARCGEVLAVDVYNRKGELLYRFFSDGKNYTTLVARAFGGFAPGWTERNPTGSHVYYSPDDIAATPESIAAVDKVLKNVGKWRSDKGKVGNAMQDFISTVGQQRRWRAEDNRQALMKAHFTMFPEYPKDLGSFCEENVFHESVLYISKLEKGKRRAVCRHCGKSFKVGREVKPGSSGVCPKCGWPVNYRAQWVKSEVTHKAKICIACKVEGRLLLRYVDVERTIYPDCKKPEYHFSDYFKSLCLVNKGKATEYAYAWCQAPYQDYDWRRLRNGTECRGESYVYTPNLREVFGERYYNVDLQAGLSGLRRPVSFRRLLDNLKNVPQAEYLMKAGLPVLAAGDLWNSKARNLPELTGLGKHFLPAMRESQADLREIQAVAAQMNPKPGDLRLVCAQRLDRESLGLLEELARYNALGRVLGYVQAQRKLFPPQAKRRKLPYFLGLYRDYLHMAEDLNSDMSQRTILEPRNLKERHDLLAARVNEVKSERENAQMQRMIDEGLYWWAHEYANEDFCVVYPQKHSDFVTEGQRLNHCVGSAGYYERHMEGKRMVFFIRKVSEPEKAYFTAEIDMSAGRILQLYGFGDCSAPREVRAFTEGFARAVVRWQDQAQERRAG
ncbi:PcfJ domain-containing protein [Acutalibacter sp. 1XD8-36]|uniref:PcfJ domain-containing protein n=1 Tax=Acutalibacter sp. 1XD8-36 TaxID=2320852 RepID=UPI002617EE93|nr:PcfJ domain-containing protein [Acutalibacter sp. 1XD8-36]